MRSNNNYGEFPPTNLDELITDLIDQGMDDLKIVTAAMDIAVYMGKITPNTYRAAETIAIKAVTEKRMDLINQACTISPRLNTPIGEFERAIIKIGVVVACEWFGHAPDSEFTKETIAVLRERYPELINKE